MLSRYLLELSLVNYSFLKYAPSLIACAALYLSNKIFQKNVNWNEILTVDST